MKIGLTGGIGSGKTTVSKYLKTKGFPIVDADLVARNLVMPKSPILKELTSIFGEGILMADGTLDRKELGNFVFTDEEKRLQLNDVTHSAICCRISEEVMRLEQMGNDSVFIDAALLFEVGLEKDMDRVWVITTPKELRVKRVAKRDGMSAERVMSIMEKQMSDEEKREKADLVIENSGTREELYQKIDEALKRM